MSNKASGVSRKKCPAVDRVLYVLLFILSPAIAFASVGAEEEGKLVTSIGVAIVAATVMAFIGTLLKQPLLLAYLAAGVIIGPKIGFGLVSSESDIEVISHIGLILLLFLIGLEIDIKKLRQSGASMAASGISQFIICVAIGLGFFFMLGYTMGGGKYDLLYLAICCGISSTAIVVKLLYGKFELDTLAGRITLGILVFQDIWAIVVLGVQPNLADPEVFAILLSFAKGGLLVVISMAISRFVLPRLFRSIAKIPEIMLVASLGWCFFICGLAALFGLSLEMGALIAGVSLSTFPYNLDVIAKVVNIRDFFITLFFVALGMQIPNPFAEPKILLAAAVASLFLIGSRFVSIYPLLYLMKNGNRVSLLTSINLSQMSEFSLVIASMGLAAGHIGTGTFTTIIFIFVITSVSSTYMIKYSNKIQSTLAKALARVGLGDVRADGSGQADGPGHDIALLGFFRVASSIVAEIEKTAGGEGGALPGERIMVVDFNPEVHRTLSLLGIRAVYGDICHPDTLHHAGIDDVKIFVSTIPDHLLVGTDNLKIIQHVRTLCPKARIIVTAESVPRALKMYAEGADYVYLPRIIAAQHLLPIIREFLTDDRARLDSLRDEQIADLRDRNEIIS